MTPRCAGLARRSPGSRHVLVLALHALVLGLVLGGGVGARADADLPAEAAAPAEEADADAGDADDGDLAEGDDGDSEVVEGSKFAGEDRLVLPGLVFGGGVLVLDKHGGSAQTFTQVGFRSELSLWQIRLGIDADLNLDDDFRPRRQDWDEPSDWPGFIDFVAFGSPGDFLYARVGRLHNATLGHGTLLGHYQSTIDLDSRKTGVEVEVNLDHLGGEAFANNVVDWEVLAARVYVDPLTWIGIPIIRSVRASVQAAVDRVAPQELIRGADGIVQLDSDDNLRFEEDTLFGFGIGVEVPLKLGPLGLTPYADLNTLSGRGSGLHLGAETRMELPIWDGIGVFAQAEYRVLDNGYLPVYFDAQYEVERFAYPERGSGLTKRAFLDELAIAQNGYMVRAGVAVPFLEVSASYETFVETEELNRLIIGAEVGGIPYVRARALFTHFGVHTLRDAFDLDERTTIAVQALIDVNSWCYVDLSFERAFRVDEREGEYTSVDAWNPSLLIGWFF